jgi:hypothetical protein
MTQKKMAAAPYQPRRPRNFVRVFLIRVFARLKYDSQNRHTKPLRS